MTVLSNVKMDAVRTDNNNLDMADMDAWKITLFYNGRQYTTNYYMGYGHRGNEPTKEMVIDSLLLDASCSDYSIEEFMHEFGYEELPKARRILEACERVAKNIYRLFTEDEIEILQEELEEGGYR